MSAIDAPAASNAFLECANRDRSLMVNLFRSCRVPLLALTLTSRACHAGTGLGLPAMVSGHRDRVKTGERAGWPGPGGPAADQQTHL